MRRSRRNGQCVRVVRGDLATAAEYLTAESDKTFVRETAKGFLKSGESSLETMARVWRE